MLIAVRTSRSIPIHGDEASAAHNYLEDMGTTKSAGDDDPLHRHTPLIDGGYGTSDDMRGAHASSRPGHPSGRTWATAQATRAPRRAYNGRKPLRTKVAASERAQCAPTAVTAKRQRMHFRSMIFA